MSGTTVDTDCPRCNGKGTLHEYSDWKPHSLVSAICLRCGYAYDTVLGIAEKETLDEQRQNFKFDVNIQPISEKDKKQMEKYDKEMYVKTGPKKLTSAEIRLVLDHFRACNLEIVDNHPKHGNVYPSDDWIIENATACNIVEPEM